MNGESDGCNILCLQGSRRKEYRMESIEKILNGPDYFLCDRFKTRMKKADCIKRQGGFTSTFGTWQHDPNMGMSFEECVDCAQGKSIRTDVGNLKSAVRDKRKPTRMDIIKKIEARFASGDEHIELGEKMTTKICTKCKKEKNREEDFHKSKTGSDGYKSVCKKCTSEYMANLRAGKVGGKNGKVKKIKPVVETGLIPASIESSLARDIARVEGENAVSIQEAAKFIIASVKKELLGAIFKELRG